MSTADAQQEEFTNNFYYSCLCNSLVLFAAAPAYLQELDGPLFDVVFELESEYLYAFEEPVFSENFRRGKVTEGLRPDLLAFRQRVEAIPGNLWGWQEMLTHPQWQALRPLADELLTRLGETRRTYSFDFTTVYRA